jgi:hypothetical protein
MTLRHAGAHPPRAPRVVGCRAECYGNRPPLDCSIGEAGSLDATMCLATSAFTRLDDQSSPGPSPRHAMRASPDSHASQTFTRFDGVGSDDDDAASLCAPCLRDRLAGARQEHFPRARANVDSSRNHDHQSPPMAGAQGEVTTQHGLEPGSTTVRRTFMLRGRSERMRASWSAPM